MTGLVVCGPGNEPGRAPKDPACWCAGLERAPEGYMSFVGWSERRIKTHRQVECPDCGDVLTLPKGWWPRWARRTSCPACGFSGGHDSAAAFRITAAGRVYGTDCTLRAFVEARQEAAR